MSARAQIKINLVEDDTSMAQALERLLQVAGYAVRWFTSSESLLASGYASDAACFVLDVHLPGMSGIELLRELIKRGLTSPVIFVTADDEPSLRDSFEQCRRATWLLKPFAGRDLLEAVAHVTTPCDAGQPVWEMRPQP